MFSIHLMVSELTGNQRIDTPCNGALSGQDVSAAYDDLMPFLIGSFNAFVRRNAKSVKAPSPRARSKDRRGSSAPMLRPRAACLVPRRASTRLAVQLRRRCESTSPDAPRGRPSARPPLRDGDLPHVARIAAARIVIESWRRRESAMRSGGPLGFKSPTPEVFLLLAPGLAPAQPNPLRRPLGRRRRPRTYNPPGPLSGVDQRHPA